MEYCVDKNVTQNIHDKCLVGGTKQEVLPDNSIHVPSLQANFGACGWNNDSARNPIPFYADVKEPELSISSYPPDWIVASAVAQNTILLNQSVSSQLAPYIKSKNIHLHMYMNMYADEQCPATFSPNSIHLDVAPVYPISAKVTRYKLKNVDQLNENDYRYDYANKKIYFKSIKADIYVSSGASCILNLSNVKDIQLTNLTLLGGVHGIRITRCQNILIDHCDFHHIPKNALIIDQSSNITVQNCNFEAIGFGGIFVSKCGQYNTLTSANIRVLNCVFRRVNKTKLTNTAYIETMYGVGMSITNCAFYDSPAAAIRSASNDTHISQCYFSNCCSETSDFGIVYQGRSVTKRGLVVSDCYFTGLKDSSGWSKHAVYCDDGYSGANVKNCIFENIPSPNTCFFSFGRDHVIENCSFSNVSTAVRIPRPRCPNASVITEYNNMMKDPAMKQLFLRAYPALNNPIQFTPTMIPSAIIRTCVVYGPSGRSYYSIDASASAQQLNNRLLPAGEKLRLPSGALSIPIANISL